MELKCLCLAICCCWHVLDFFLFIQLQKCKMFDVNSCHAFLIRNVIRCDCEMMIAFWVGICFSNSTYILACLLVCLDDDICMFKLTSTSAYNNFLQLQFRFSLHRVAKQTKYFTSINNHKSETVLSSPFIRSLNFLFFFTFNFLMKKKLATECWVAREEE